MNDKKLNRMILMALMVAVSFIGSNIKLPGLFSTIAFDSFPAYFSGLLLGGIPGGLVGLLGHLMTSYLSGFPFGLPIHAVISLMMFVSVLVFAGVSKRLNVIWGVIAGVAINGILMPMALVVMPGFEWAMAVAFMPVLTAASAANVVLAVIVHRAVSRTGLAARFRDDGL